MKIKSEIYVWIFALLLLLYPALPANAKTEALTNLETQGDITVVIRYDKADPAIRLTAPDGAIYEKDGDYAQVERVEGVSYYYIVDAPAGSWSIDYDQGPNTSVIYDVVYWHRGPTISNLTVTPNGSESVSVQADVSFDKDTTYDYYVYAVLLDKDGKEDGSKEISSGSAGTNQKLELEASLDSLPDGENYHIKLEAVITYPDEVEAPAALLSDNSFNISGHTAKGNQEELTTVLNLTEGILTIDWTGITEDFEKCLVAMSRGEGDSEPVFFETYENNGEENIIDLNVDIEDNSPVTVALSLMSGGKVTGSYSRTILIENGVTCGIETAEVTNSRMAEISYDAGDKELQAVLKVGETTQNLELKGSGIFSVPLEEMATSDISLRYWWENGNDYEVTSRISSDTVPPMLILYGVPDTVTTSESRISISGQTEAGAALEVNETAAEIRADGSFTVSIALSKGENDIIFTASDDSGNKTSNAVKVIRTTGKTSIKKRLKQFQWKDFLLSAALALLWLLILFISSLIAKKKQYHRGKMAFTVSVLFMIFCLMGCLAWIGYYAVRYHQLGRNISGQSLIDVLKNASAAGVTLVLNERTEYLNKMRIPLALAICLVVLLIALFAARTLTRSISAQVDSAKKDRQRRKQEKEARKVSKTWKPTESRKGGAGNKRVRVVFCPNCGTRYEIKPGEKLFCGKCGIRIE